MVQGASMLQCQHYLINLLYIFKKWLYYYAKLQSILFPDFNYSNSVFDFIVIDMIHGQHTRWRKWRACDIGEAKERLENELRRRWSDRKVGEWAELIDIEIYSRAHSPTFQSLHLHHSSFSNSSLPLPTSQLILQPFCCFTYVTAYSPTLPSLYLRHSSFSNPSVALPTSQIILQPFCCFTYITVHSPTLLSLLLRHKFFT